MPNPKPLSRTPSEQQRVLLECLVRRQTSSQRLARRAKTILAAANGASNERIAAQLGVRRTTVRLWRQRWHDAAEALKVAAASGESPQALRKRLVSMLDDAPRPGAPGDFSADQLAQLISVACESPEDSGRPVPHGTPRELRDEVIKRGLVDNISTRTVGRFLKRSRAQTVSLDILAQSSAR